MFDKSPNKTYIQVLYLGTHWLRFWAQLQRHEEDKEVLQKACQTLERGLDHAVIANYGWRFSNRISS